MERRSPDQIRSGRVGRSNWSIRADLVGVCRGGTSCPSSISCVASPVRSMGHFVAIRVPRSLGFRAKFRR